MASLPRKLRQDLRALQTLLKVTLFSLIFMNGQQPLFLVRRSPVTTLSASTLKRLVNFEVEAHDVWKYGS